MCEIPELYLKTIEIDLNERPEKITKDTWIHRCRSLLSALTTAQAEQRDREKRETLIIEATWMEAMDKAIDAVNDGWRDCEDHGAQFVLQGIEAPPRAELLERMKQLGMLSEIESRMGEGGKE